MKQTLPHRSLGKSDLMITPIGLGCWQFSKQQNMAGKFWPTIENNTINSIVKTSLEGGINWFDTAEVYGNGAWNEPCRMHSLLWVKSRAKLCWQPNGGPCSGQPQIL